MAYILPCRSHSPGGSGQDLPRLLRLSATPISGIKRYGAAKAGLLCSVARTRRAARSRYLFALVALAVKLRNDFLCADGRHPPAGTRRSRSGLPVFLRRRLHPPRLCRLHLRQMSPHFFACSLSHGRRAELHLGSRWRLLRLSPPGLPHSTGAFGIPVSFRATALTLTARRGAATPEDTSTLARHRLPVVELTPAFRWGFKSNDHRPVSLRCRDWFVVSPILVRFTT